MNKILITGNSNFLRQILPWFPQGFPMKFYNGVFQYTVWVK